MIQLFGATGGVIAALVLLALAIRAGTRRAARHAGPAHAEPPHADPPHADSPHAEPAHADSPHAEPPHADSPHADSPHADLPHAYLAHAHVPRAPVVQAPSRWRVLRWLARISIDQWRAIDAETPRIPGDAGRTSFTVLAVLATVAGALTLQEYLGGHDMYDRLFPHGGAYWELYGYAWWSGWRVFGYVVIPMIVLACLGERIRDYHLSLRGFFKHLWIYVVLFAAVLPAVLLASTTHEFRQTYPFYRLANRSYLDLVLWELLYAAQFLSLEFFFRGFILHGLRRALGANAIFVMIVPYCMIHYGKPLAETLGAVGAGLILGTLAMRTRSIWGGVLIHVGVATTMDVLALRGCPPFGGGACH